MNLSTKVMMTCAALALAACTNATSWNGGGDDVSNSVDLNQPGLVGDVTSPSYFQQAIGDRVLFSVDQHSLGDEARAILTAQAEWLINNPSYSATIEGHADEQGTREYNLGLGARRANEAKEFLVSRGVAGNRLRTVSYGKERPIEICSAESCYSQNRRAVTVLVSDLTG
jgi:peptidoglycan-associated lipoprotein